MVQDAKILRIVRSKSFNPWYNLALEEHLLNNLKPDEVLMYLWQNDKTVVIGRNQNAWKECAWKKLEDDGGRLARRMSGGGAVYHDMGNLNFTLIYGMNDADLDRDNQIVIDALAELNVTVTTGQNDMLIGGRKFSDHTWYKSGGRVCHHGTLLVSSDLDKLEYYLSPANRKIRSRGVESVPVEVINIKDANPTATVAIVRKSLEQSCEKHFGLECDSSRYEIHTDSVLDIYDRYASWQWRFGKSPDFDIEMSTNFTWGNVELAFSFQNGEIKNCEVYTDAMDPSLFTNFKKHLKGCPFMSKYVARAARESIEDETISQDMERWLTEANI